MSRILIIFFALTIALPAMALVSEVTNNPLWPLQKDHWDAGDEDVYAQWILDNATPDVLKGSELVFDCAETAMALRWIFSYQHGLPAAQTLGNGTLFGSWQSTKAWDQLPHGSTWQTDARFKAGLKFLLQNAYTHTLINDLYPVEIDRNYVRAGTIYLLLRTVSGHTTTITQITSAPPCFGPCLLTVWGDEPASDNVSFSQAPLEALAKGQGGFMRFRWAERVNGRWSLRPAKQMPGYSEEQYSWTSIDYLSNIAVKLQLWSGPKAEILTMAQALLNSWAERWQITERAYYLCSIHHCTAGGAEDVTYSTPVRDQSAKDQTQVFEGLVHGNLADTATLRIAQTTLSKDLTGSGYPLNPWQAMQANTNPATGWNSASTVDIFARWGWQDQGTLDEAEMLAKVLYDNWQWREELVRQAQDICYPSGGAFACGRMTAALKALLLGLDTTDLDFAFREARKALEARVSVLSSIDQKRFNAWIESWPIGQSCGDQSCSLADLLQENSIIDQMTSSPLDPISSRRPAPQLLQ